MPDLQQALAEKERADKAAEAQQAAQQETEVQRRKMEQCGHYERLLENEDFQWFMETLGNPAIKAEHDAALSLKNTPEQRSNHAHRHEALTSLLHGLEATRARLRSELAKLAEKMS